MCDDISEERNAFFLSTPKTPVRGDNESLR